MPIYAYKCASCGHAKDVLQKMSDVPLTVCPTCGAETFSKQLTAAGFQLKGSGWYATDFKGGGAAAAPAAGAAPADGGTSAPPAAGAGTANGAPSQTAASSSTTASSGAVGASSSTSTATSTATSAAGGCGSSCACH